MGPALHTKSGGDFSRNKNDKSPIKHVTRTLEDTMAANIEKIEANVKNGLKLGKFVSDVCVFDASVRHLDQQMEQFIWGITKLER